MKTRSLILSLLILVSSAVILSAQSVSATPSASPGKLSQPYTPTGQQVQLLAYHPTGGEGSGAVTLTFPIATGEQLYSYTTSIQEAQPVATAQYAGTTVTVPNAQLECGYFTAQPSQIMMTRVYYWVFDYSRVSLSDLALTADYDAAEPCQQVMLALSRPLAPISYHTLQGATMQADRGLVVRYQDLVYQEEAHVFTAEQKEEQLPETNGGAWHLIAPLTDTSFAIIGDRFTEGVAEQYGLPIESPVLQARRVELHARYRLLSAGQSQAADSTASNASQLPSSLSAPATVEIDLVANEPAAVIYQIVIVEGAAPSEEAPVVMQFNGRQAQYTFDKMGTYTLYGTVSDRTASCTATSQPVVVTVQSSRLEVPNVFTPFSSPGVNDLFQVVHQSLISFEGRIYDSWGGLIYSWSDPDGGWDGTCRGKPVPSGVYYYVITAEGADGVQYHKSGDVNILESDYSQQPNFN